MRLTWPWEVVWVAGSHCVLMVVYTGFNALHLWSDVTSCTSESMWITNEKDIYILSFTLNKLKLCRGSCNVITVSVSTEMWGNINSPNRNKTWIPENQSFDPFVFVFIPLTTFMIIFRWKVQVASKGVYFRKPKVSFFSLCWSMNSFSVFCDMLMADPRKHSAVL